MDTILAVGIASGRFAPVRGITLADAIALVRLGRRNAHQTHDYDVRLHSPRSGPSATNHEARHDGVGVVGGYQDDLTM